MEDLLKLIEASKQLEQMKQDIWSKIVRKTGYGKPKINNRLPFSADLTNEKEQLFRNSEHKASDTRDY